MSSINPYQSPLTRPEDDVAPFNVNQMDSPTRQRWTRVSKGLKEYLLLPILYLCVWYLGILIKKIPSEWFSEREEWRLITDLMMLSTYGVAVVVHVLVLRKLCAAPHPRRSKIYFIIAILLLCILAVSVTFS